MPWPLSRALFLYGEPIEVPRRLTSEKLEDSRLLVERRLNELIKEGERDFEKLWAGGIAEKTRR